MCGIAGFVSASEETEASARQAVQQMCKRMRSRGPDASGAWASHGAVLGHQRLAIIDLDIRANQPMISGDGRHVIVFNGEIYNFRELRRGLEGQGVVFRTTSDTEVLLALFGRERERMLPKLRGMFAFAIWDSSSRELFLARDPYGIKPLYYTRTKDGLLFASQVKGLLASGMVPAERESAGLAGFYLWGSVPEPWTMYRGVLALPAGHWLRVRGNELAGPVCWHDIRRHWQGESMRLPPAELRERVRLAVTDSVRAHLVADVPVSIFLSGGIDSGVVAGLAASLGATVEGITIGFPEFTGRHEDETPAAAAIAQHYGLRHHVRSVSRNEFEQDIPRILEAMDQPSIDGVNTWFACKAAAERGYKVVLSGVGGDELFCGYPSFQQIPRAALLGRIAAALPGMRSLMRVSLAALAKQRSQPKLAGIPAFMGSLGGNYFLRKGLFLPDELPAMMGEELAREGLARLGGSPPGMTSSVARDGTATVGMLESTLYLRNQLLRDSDWASMGHSLELRTPLVDTALLETLGPCVSGFARRAGKAMLAQSPEKALPGSVLHRPKTGFSIPMTEWLTALASQSFGAAAPSPKPTGTPWARHWARVLAGRSAPAGG